MFNSHSVVHDGKSLFEDIVYIRIVNLLEQQLYFSVFVDHLWNYIEELTMVSYIISFQVKNSGKFSFLMG